MSRTRFSLSSSTNRLAAYAFRLYRAAFGNHQPFPNPDLANPTEANKLPSYAVFSGDRARVVGGASLAQGQLNLANVFVTRAEFVAKYPASQDGPTFVDALVGFIRNDTGVDLASQRAALYQPVQLRRARCGTLSLADDNGWQSH